MTRQELDQDHMRSAMKRAEQRQSITLPNSASLFWKVLDAVMQGEIHVGYHRYYTHDDGNPDYKPPKRNESVTGRIYPDIYRFDINAPSK